MHLSSPPTPIPYPLFSTPATILTIPIEAKLKSQYCVWAVWDSDLLASLGSRTPFRQGSPEAPAAAVRPDSAHLINEVAWPQTAGFFHRPVRVADARRSRARSRLARWNG